GRRHLAQIPRRAVLRESADRRHENSEGGKRRPGHPFDHAAGSAVGMARLMPLMLARVLARGPAVRGEIFSAHRNWLRRALHDQDAVRHETEIAAHRLEVLAQLRRMLDRQGSYACRRFDLLDHRPSSIRDYATTASVLTAAQGKMSILDLYYWTTPNGHKITIFLEETALRYKVMPVHIGKGEQFKAEFLAVSPNNRLPAIVDHAPAEGGKPISLFESGAILLYLADK